VDENYVAWMKAILCVDEKFFIRIEFYCVDQIQSYVDENIHFSDESKANFWDENIHFSEEFFIVWKYFIYFSN